MKLNYYIPFILFFFLLISKSYGISEGEIQSAKEALKKGAYGEVDQILEKCKYEVELGDKAAQEAMFLLASSAFLQKNGLVAEQYLDRVILANPSFLPKYDVMLLKLKILLEKNDFFLAEKTMNLIWEMPIGKPEKYASLDELVARYSLNREFALCESYLENLMARTDDETDLSKLKLSLMECLLLQGKLGKAGELLKSIELIDSSEPMIRDKMDLLTGRFFVGGKEYDKGLRQYLKLYQKDDLSGTARQEALFGLALSYWNLGNGEKAREALEEYVGSYPLASNLLEAKLMLSQVYLKEREYERARKILEELIDRPVHDELFFKSLYWLGEAYYRQKEYDKAKNVYEQLITSKTIDPLNEVYGNFGLAWVYYDQKRIEKACDYFQATFSLPLEHKFVKEAGVMAGDCLYLLKKYPEAEKVYTAFLNKVPCFERSDEILYKLALIRAKLSRRKDSRDALDTLVSRYPSSPFAEKALLDSAKMYTEDGKYEEAALKNASFVRAFPKSEFADSAALEVGNCYYNQGMYHEALLAYQSASVSVTKKEIRDKAAYYMGWCYSLLKEEDKTIRLFSQFLKDSPSSGVAPQMLFWLGEHDFNSNRFSEAAQKLKKLISDYPESDLIDNGYYLEGKSFFKMKDFQGAVLILSEFITRIPRSELIPDARYLRGECFLSLGRLEEARSDFMVFETVFTNSYLRKSAFERLGDLFVSQKQYAGAIGYYEKAGIISRSDQARDDHMLILKEAECYNLSGDVNKALELGKQVIYDDVPSWLLKSALDFCVDIFKAKGDYEEAIRFLSGIVAERKDIDENDLKARIRKLKYYESHRKETR